ncbi:MAG: hypothetical protein KAS12_05745, partial [Candidatus Aenigmarchaeota archaeon]|nr:hypothetical protein [Candidatus Aenigmarchaeota archaeon]
VIKDNANNFQQTSTTISSNYNVGTKAYITYTTGNIEDIKQRIILIRGNTYNMLYNPSFAFPIAKKNTLEVGIEYDSINIGNDDVLKPGFNNIVIKNIGFINNKNSLSITKE